MLMTQSSYFSEFIAKAEAEQQAMAIKSTFAAWNYESNITEETKEPYLKLQKDSSKLTKQHGKEAQNFNISVIEVTVCKYESAYLVAKKPYLLGL